MYPGTDGPHAESEISSFAGARDFPPAVLLLPQHLASLTITLPKQGFVSCRLLNAVDPTRLIEDLLLLARVWCERCDMQCPPEGDRLGKLVDQVAEGVLILDSAEGNILHANPAAQTLFGRSTQELQGEHFGLPVHSGDHAEIEIFCERGLMKTVEIRLGTTTWDDRDAFLASLRDVTRQKQMKHRLQEAIQQAEDANKAKSDFLARVSHDIRTPVSGIVGMADITMASGLPEQQRKHIESIKTSAQYLLAILNDILDFSRIEAGNIQLEEQPIDLRSELEPSIAYFAKQCAESGLTFRAAIAANVPETLKGDPVRIRRIVDNLLTNAVKYTERGSVELAVECLGISPGEDLDVAKIRFAISDTGVGIPNEFQSRIFTMFAQGTSDSTKARQGVGLGLCIVRHLCQVMGGSVDFDSQEGKGSVFRVTLPLQLAPDASPSKPDVAEAPLPAARPCRILLVEDNQVNQLFTMEMLRTQGHDVTVRENGREALDILTKERFDLVLMDIMMPVMDGLEATLAIRDPQSGVLDHDVPIIALTAHAIKGDQERFMSHGMDAYVSKPVDFQILYAEIARLMHNRPLLAEQTSSASDQPQPKQPAPAASDRPSDAVSPIDETWMHKMLQTRSDFLKRMFEVFLAEEPTRLEKIRQAVQDEDMEQIRFLAHSTKGATATLGASTAREHAHALELAAKEQDAEAVAAAHQRLEAEMHRVFGFMSGFLATNI